MLKLSQLALGKYRASVGLETARGVKVKLQ